jgi:hypothetical protein
LELPRAERGRLRRCRDGAGTGLWRGVLVTHGVGAFCPTRPAANQPRPPAKCANAARPRSVSTSPQILLSKPRHVRNSQSGLNVYRFRSRVLAVPSRAHHTRSSHPRRSFKHRAQKPSAQKGRRAFAGQRRLTRAWLSLSKTYVERTSRSCFKSPHCGSSGLLFK